MSYNKLQKTIFFLSSLQVIISIMIQIFSGGVFQPTGQGGNSEVQPYLQPGEDSIKMTSVIFNGRPYSLYIVSTDITKVTPYDRVFYQRDQAYWTSHGVNAVLVFDDQHKLVTDHYLLRNIFLSQIGGYIATQSTSTYLFVPADDIMITEMSNKSKEPAFVVAFVTQEAKSIFKTDSTADAYAEVIRLAVASKNQNASDFAKDVRGKVETIHTWKAAIDEVMTTAKYSNDKNIRETAKNAIKYFENWEKYQAPSQLQFKIGKYDVSFANWLDLGELAINLIFLQESSPQKMEIFNDLAELAHSGNISLSQDLLSAIGTVSLEVNDPAVRQVDLIMEFVEDHAFELASDLSEQVFRDMVTKFIWKKAGTRVAGHILAGAFSSVFLAFSIADVMFGMDQIYENMIVAENAAKITSELNINLNQLEPSFQASFSTYPESATTFRKLAIAWNLSMAQSFASYSEAIYASRLLKAIADLFSDQSWEQAAAQFQKFATNGINDTVNILLNPTLLDYAISQVDLRKTQQPISSVSSSSSTVLVLDTSGSMNEADVSGRSKLQAAQAAATNILDVIAAEVQSGTGQGSQVGLVDFNAGSTIDSPLSTDINAVRNSLQSLYANGGTGMADGLQNGLSLFANQSTTVKQMIILLSDGNPNIPLSGGAYYDLTAIQQEVLDLAAQAGDRSICVYTIGFGVPNTQGTLSLGDASIDEDFLRRVAEASRCGAYYNAQNASQLANVFVELRHTSMGSVIFQQSGQISQDQQIDLGNVTVPTNQELLLLTLNWPGSKLEPVLKDPTGVVVDQNYPGATISSTSTLVSIVLSNPKAGDWNFSVIGVDVPEGTTVYNTLISTRAGTTILPPQGSGSFPIVILILVIFGGGIGVYVYSRSIQRTGRRSAAATPGTQLVGTYGTAAGQTINLYDGLIIGRGSASGLRLNDPSVSRAHASLRFAQGAWFIQDLGSKSGIIVNGQKVSATRLNPGDQIQIGGSAFIFKSGGK